MPDETETEETVGFVTIIFIIDGILIGKGGLAPWVCPQPPSSLITFHKIPSVKKLLLNQSKNSQSQHMLSEK